MSDFNKEVFRGNDREIKATFLDPDGEPANLDGVDLHYRVALDPESPTLLSIDRPTITHQANVATIPLTAAQMRALAVGRYYHEIYEVRAGKIVTLKPGALSIVGSQAALHEDAS